MVKDDSMLGYGAAPRRHLSLRRKLLRRLPELAPGLAGAVAGSGLVLVISGGAFDPLRMVVTAAVIGVVFWLVQRRLQRDA